MNTRDRIFVALGGLIAFVIAASAHSEDNEIAEEFPAFKVDPQWVRGVVVDEAGKPIAGVRVEARTPVVGFHSSFSMPTGGERFPGPPRIAITDARGRFRIDKLYIWNEKQVQLTLSARHRHVNDRNYPTGEDLQITMSGSGRPGVIQGRLVDATTGRPVPLDADVRIVRRYSPTVHTFAAEDGRFVIPRSASLDNDYTIYVYANGYAATEGKIKAIIAGSDVYQDIELGRRPPLRGKLLDAQTGESISGASILNGFADDDSYFEWSSFDNYADGHHGLDFVQHEKSDDDGGFWFAEADDKAAGTLFVLADGYARHVLRPEDREFDKTTGQLLVRVPRESGFTGAVLQDGKPLRNAKVRAHPLEKIGTMEQWYAINAKTDTEGRYRLGGLPAGTYIVRGGPYGRRATVNEGEVAELNFGGDVGAIRIYGKTTEDASITIIPEFEWDYTSFEARSDAAGKYECAGLTPGKYRAHISAGGGGLFINYSVGEFVVERDGQQVDLLPGGRRK